jgi:DNA-binding NarL/FixJ family response regulator
MVEYISTIYPELGLLKILMIRVFLVHEIKLMCNIVSAALEDEADIRVVGTATTVEEAFRKIAPIEVDVVLASTRLPEDGAIRLTRSMVEESGDVQVLALGVSDSKEKVLQYIEAGAVGYVLKNDSLDDLLAAIRAANKGKALVSPKIAAALIERVSELARMFSDINPDMADSVSLTEREMEVLELIAQELTNHEIAERLVIEVGTVKNHVHNILKKLNVSNREEAATYLAILK